MGKVITKFKLFKEALELAENDPDPVKTAKTRLNTYETNIEEFNKNKGKLEQLVLNATTNVDSEITKIVGEGDDQNDLLSRLLQVLLLQKKIKQGKERLEYYTQLKTEREGDIRATGKLSDEEEKANQIESLQNQIKEIDAKYKSMQENLKMWEKEHQEGKAELEEYVKKATEEIEDHVDTLDKNVTQFK